MSKRRSRFEREVDFIVGQGGLPYQRKLDLLAWLRERRKGQGNGHPPRDFWLLTETGEWKRL
jgi:hypothetical protein